MLGSLQKPLCNKLLREKSVDIFMNSQPHPHPQPQQSEHIHIYTI